MYIILLEVEDGEVEGVEGGGRREGLRMVVYRQRHGRARRDEHL
jgi:hypothetical protein